MYYGNTFRRRQQITATYAVSGGIRVRTSEVVTSAVGLKSAGGSLESAVT